MRSRHDTATVRHFGERGELQTVGMTSARGRGRDQLRLLPPQRNRRERGPPSGGGTKVKPFCQTALQCCCRMKIEGPP
jgi:hypothetical protein